MAKRKRSKPTTERSLKWCRDLGWMPWVVERWLLIRIGEPCQSCRERKMAPRRKDLYGIGDIIALDGFPGVALVQTCAGSRLADHRRKMLTDRDCADYLERWLAAGNRFYLIGWSKRSNGRWGARVERGRRIQQPGRDASLGFELTEEERITHPSLMTQPSLETPG